MIIGQNAKFFINSLFLATTASIISGAMAERVNVYGYVIFVIIMGLVMYPVIGGWIMTDGWLYILGFKDFSGATFVHSVGGWFALTGIFVLGARLERYDEKGILIKFKSDFIPFGTLGTMLIWIGFLGFNTGALKNFDSEHAMHFFSTIMINTTFSGAIGVLTILFITGIGQKSNTIKKLLNGCLASLVSITAFPYSLDTGIIMFVSIVGAIGSYYVEQLMQRMRLDDVVGAVPVHLVGGVWGTLAVGFFGQADFKVQLLGVTVVGLVCLITSFVVWKIIDYTVGIRISEAEELSD